MTKFNVACLNVHDLTVVRRQAGLIDNVRVHRINAMVATETKLSSLQSFIHFLADNEKIMSLCQAGEKGGVIVLYCKSSALEVSTFFVDPEGKLVYTSHKWQWYKMSFLDMETYMVTSKILVFLGDFNAMLNA